MKFNTLVTFNNAEFFPVVVLVLFVGILGSQTMVAAHVAIFCPLDEAAEGDTSVSVLHPSHTNCNEFYKCNRGVAIKNKCPDGLHYNAEIEVKFGENSIKKQNKMRSKSWVYVGSTE